MTVAELENEVLAEQALSDKIGEYAGAWVAVRDHDVVASAASLNELLEKITAEAIEADSVFEVAEDSAAVCFF